MQNILIPLFFIILAIVFIIINTRTYVKRSAFNLLEDTFDKIVKINRTINNNDIEIVVFRYKLLDKNHAAVSVVNKTTNTSLITNINIVNKFYKADTDEFLIFSKNITQQDASGNNILNFNLDLWMNKDHCIRFEISNI
jgi:hypothetical protein